MKTREELKAILDEWIPKYIRQVVELRSGSRLSAERYNELMNLLITQGDDTIELAETVKQYMELLVEDMTAEFEETTEAVTGLANNAVSTANSAVTSVNNYKTIMDSNMQQFKTSVNNTVTNMSADIAAFKESVSQSIAASDVKVNTAVATANKLTADMEAYRVELNQLTEQTFTEMQNALSTQVSADVISGVAALKAELLKDINTTITTLEEQVMTIANTAEQSVNSAIQDIEAYKSGMDARLDEALKEVEDSLSVAGDIIQDASAIYSKIDEMNTLVNSYESRLGAIEEFVENADFANSDHTHSQYSATGHKHTKSEITDFPTSMTPTTHTHDDRYYTETEVNNLLANKAASSHGNHVPAVETANNAKFLRNDNTWQTVTPANIGAAASSHGTHVSFSTTAPVMDGTASVGSASTVARSDHKHPTDTSRAAATHTHTKSQITDFPTSLPASDVYSWAKTSAKPTYTWSEITSKPTSFTPASHNQAASTITAGTFAGQVNANATAMATLGNAQVRDMYAGTSDMTAGTTSLTTGSFYVMYE
jgi:hypothetical protein